MKLRPLVSLLIATLVAAIGCRPEAQGAPVAPDVGSPARVVAPRTEPAPAVAEAPAPAPATVRLRHPGEPRTRSEGGLERLTANSPAQEPTGGPASPCAGRAPGETWAGATGTCSCRPDGQMTCWRQKASSVVR